MENSARTTLFPAFAIVWFILGVSSFLFFSINKNAELKKRVLSWLVWGTGVLFAGFVYYETRAPYFMLIVIPATFFICYLNVKYTKFCPSCGTTLFNYNWFRAMKYCQHCGACLEDKPHEPQNPR